jgi:hypothetical protein
MKHMVRKHMNMHMNEHFTEGAVEQSRMIHDLRVVRGLRDVHDVRRVFGVLLFTLAFAILPSFASAATLQKAPSHLGLVGYWTFDGQQTNWSTMITNDSSGNGNDGTLTNMTATSSAMGKIGQGLKFDGANDFVQLEGNFGVGLYQNNTSYSISQWVKGGVQNGKDIWYEGRGNCTGGSFDLYAASAGKVGLYLANDAIGILVNGVTSNTTAFDNTWHHIVWTDNNGTAKLYIDGVQDSANFNYTRSGAFVWDRTFIAHDNSCSSNYFNGSIDDVRAYNRALTPTEVKKLYNSGIAKINSSRQNRLTSGLVGYWTMDGRDVTDAAGGIFDRSGNGNTCNRGGFDNFSVRDHAVIGKIGQALSFDYSNQNNADCGNSASLQITGSYSISTWFKASSFLGGYKSIFGKMNSAAGCAYGLGLNDESSGIWKVGSFASSDGTCASGATMGERYTATTLVLNKWYHVTSVYNASNQTINIYLNGVLDNGSVGGTIPASIYNTPDVANIGGSNWAGSYFSGNLDDLRVYNRALTATEVRQLYMMGGGVPTITMGEQRTAGGDDSGNANHLLAQQATTTQAATLQSLSFYVNTAAGNLRMGVYDATGPSGGPGNKIAETYEVTPVVGWNTVQVTTPVVLPPGTYWLAYLPNNNGLHFSLYTGGMLCNYAYAYGTLPSTFSASPTCTGYHWSFYATLNTGLSGAPVTINHTQAGKQTNGLVGYWSFNGQDTNWRTNQTYDLSGNYATGTMDNMSTTSSPAPGKIGQALKFDGVDDSVEISDPGTGSVLDFANGSSITLSAWVKPDTFDATWGSILVKETRNVIFSPNYSILHDNGCSGSSPCPLIFYYDSGSCNETAQHIFRTSGNVLTPGVWQLITVTFTFGTGSTMKIYINNNKKIKN